MARFIRKKKPTIGKVPGEPIFIGTKKVDSSSFNLIEYSETEIIKTASTDFKQIKKTSEKENICWLNITGLHEIEKIRELLAYFKIHPLIMEDIVNTGQRPKIEEHKDYIFVIAKTPFTDKLDNRLKNEQISFILKDNMLISFTEKPLSVFSHVEERLTKKLGRIRNSGADYLFYALLDSIIDNFLLVTEEKGDEIEDLEDLIHKDIKKEIPALINSYKQEIGYLRKTIRPIREAVQKILTIDSALIRQGTKPFLRDLMDLIVQASETCDAYREILSDYLNIHNSLISNRLNKVMTILTVFSAIFIPLSFLAGLYGTNFEYIPGAKSEYGFIVFSIFTIIFGLVLFKYFRSKKWI